MSNLSRIHPRYRAMLEIPQPAVINGAVSVTQFLLLSMDPGTRWSHQVSHRVYSRGGDEGGLKEKAQEAGG